MQTIILPSLAKRGSKDAYLVVDLPHDGFRDGSQGFVYAPPDVPVYASEYAAGFGNAIHPERQSKLTARESSHAA